jgi:hypothetical protein
MLARGSARFIFGGRGARFVFGGRGARFVFGGGEQ